MPRRSTSCAERAGEGSGEFVHAGDESPRVGATRGRVERDQGTGSRCAIAPAARCTCCWRISRPPTACRCCSNDPIESGDAWVTLYGDDPSHAFHLVEGRETEETIDRFKLIASTERVDGFLLEQDDLELGATVPATRALGSVKAKQEGTQPRLVHQGPARARLAALNELGEKPWASANGAIVVKGHRKLKAK